MYELRNLHTIYLHSPIKSGRVLRIFLSSAHFWHLQCRPSDLMGFLFLVEMAKIHETYYPIFGVRSKIHIIGNSAKTTICGGSVGYLWEMVYGSAVFPEIGGILINSQAKTPEFINCLRVGADTVPMVYFCPKCYQKYTNEILNNK